MSFTPLDLFPVRAAAFPRPIHPFRPPEPHAIVERVEPGSIADELGIRPGDEILSINGHRLEDVIDYRFHVADETVAVVVAPGGDRERPVAYEIEKDVDETLGVTFTADVFDGIRICTNNCDFCFVYQNRRRMRKSVYVKDDDYRLSFLHGDFITLTNLTERCWERILEYRLSPLYVSIHAVDPEVRTVMLRNPEARRLREHLGRLFDGGIEIHGQVVLTPGINDGPHLEETVEEMAALYGGPHGGGCRTLAIVPVGLTTQRSNLPVLRTVSPHEAREVVRRSREWQARFRRTLGTRFVFPSDEFYLLAGEPLPPATAYESFPQYENGVGMIPRMLRDWRRESRRLPERLPRSRRSVVVTGALAAPVLEPMVRRLNEIEGLSVGLCAVPNRFFGETVTVAGLLTGQDIAAALGGIGPGDEVVVPAAAVRDEWFLDDWTLDRLSAEVGRPVRVAAPTAAGLIRAALGSE